MQDYHKMYIKLFQATENAISVLIAAQRECEELSISALEPELKVLSAFQGPSPEAADQTADHAPSKTSR